MAIGAAMLLALSAVPSSASAARLEAEHKAPPVAQVAHIQSDSQTPEASAGQPEHRPKGDWALVNDPVNSMATDYDTYPSTAEAVADYGMQTAFRVENLREMSYSQFLILVREGHVQKVRYADNMKSAYVTTTETCPGRPAATEKVGLIYDPGLYDYLGAHGVEVDPGGEDRTVAVQVGLLRLVTPVLIASMVIAWSLTLGRGPTTRDPVFGGARMELVNPRDVPTTFDDVAGIDEIKEEIMEVVSFLRDQELYLELGARAPAGVLLCGPPGMGKTLLAKAIAGEAGVPFYNSSGADFSNMFVGVGAARVRDMFERARNDAPCILFIDEFDGIGQARSENSSGGEENVQTINQLLTEMDGFDDNTGVVVLAATNRPSSLDSALTRPGRFDRIIALPYPNLTGRVAILHVHARGKPLDDSVDFQRVARATAGFSGAELMNLMNTAAMEAVHQRRPAITEDDLFTALERVHAEQQGGVAGARGMDRAAGEDGVVSPLVRRTIATFVAAKALVGILTPGYDELQKAVVTPGGTASGYTYFIPQDAHLETEILTRSFLESQLCVTLSGRVGEVAVMGAANVTVAGARDIETATAVARDMVLRCGWSPRLGPVNVGDDGGMDIANMSPVLAGAALMDVHELMAAAEAKAYFGIVTNWELLAAMVDHLVAEEEHTLTRLDVEKLMKSIPPVRFVDTAITGFYFDSEHRLHWPASYSHLVEGAEDADTHRRTAAAPIVGEGARSETGGSHPLNPFPFSGAYQPLSGAFLGASDFYFRTSLWEDGSGSNGAQSPRASQDAEPSSAAQ